MALEDSIRNVTRFVSGAKAETLEEKTDRMEKTAQILSDRVAVRTALQKRQIEASKKILAAQKVLGNPNAIAFKLVIYGGVAVLLLVMVKSCFA